MDRVGRGVAYTSPDEGVIVGMGGRSDVGVSSFGVASLSSRPPRREEKLGWRLNDMRRRTRRNKVGSVVVASICPSIGGSCTPNDLLGTAILSGLDGFMLCYAIKDRGKKVGSISRFRIMSSLFRPSRRPILSGPFSESL